MKNKKNTINFIINPTYFHDFDIVALGNIRLLRKIAKDNEYHHLIKKSIWGCPLVVLDTTDTIRNAKSLINHYRKTYKDLK